MGANMVQFVKTHYPERQGAAPFRACMAVLLVRNPFDAMESYFNLMMTGTHTATVSDEIRRKTAQAFEEYVLKEIRVWIGFHNFWMNQDIPILLVRYEDLIRKPDKAMARVLQFVLEVKYMGTFFTERIERCIKEQAEIERMGSYKPRSGGIGKSLSKYSPALLHKLKSNVNLRRMMGHLGYADLLEKPPEEWSDLTPLEDYATEYLPSWHNTGKKKVVLLNQGRLARTEQEQTQWMQIKNSLGIFEKDCDCPKCVALKEKKAKEDREKEAASGSANEGSGEPEGKATESEEEVKGKAEATEDGRAMQQDGEESQPAPGADEDGTLDHADSGGTQGEKNEDSAKEQGSEKNA